MRRALLPVLLLALASCAAIDRAAPVRDAGSAPSFFGRSPAEELVAYASQVRAMSDAGLAAEAARQRREGSELARVKAAIALTLSHQADEGEILALVDPIAKRDAGDAGLRSMASFLQVLATDRRRLKESATAAGTRLRDERKALEAQKSRADALQERAAQLQQKIDALTELEKSLSDRQAPGR